MGWIDGWIDGCGWIYEKIGLLTCLPHTRIEMAESAPAESKLSRYTTRVYDVYMHDRI